MSSLSSRAADGIRTRCPQLGKLVLNLMSFNRMSWAPQATFGVAVMLPQDRACSENRTPAISLPRICAYHYH